MFQLRTPCLCSVLDDEGSSLRQQKLDRQVRFWRGPSRSLKSSSWSSCWHRDLVIDGKLQPLIRECEREVCEGYSLLRSLTAIKMSLLTVI